MNNNKFINFNQRIIFIFSLCLAFFVGVFVTNLTQHKVRGNLFAKDSVIDEGYFRYYNMFRQAYQILQKEFVDPEYVDAKTLLSGAIKGMLTATEDPYTDFLSPEIAKEFSADLNASFYGVGIRIEMRNNWLTVVAPIKGTPAAEAGLQSGDQIIEINKESTEGMTFLEAVSKIRGKLGTTVAFTIVRPGVLQPVDVVLKRAKIDVDTVESAMIEHNNKKIAYIKLIEFSIPTEKEFETTLKKVLAQTPDGIILDVRNNPGGLLSSVSKIADMILEEGLIVYTKGRMDVENIEYKASPKNTLISKNIPITILGDQGSASASEILIGALKDTKRATFVGKKTFGKGSVQKTHALSDGSILKYTIAKYYSPDGNVIDKIGIYPDVKINMWYDDLTDAQKTSVIQIQMTNYIPDFLQQTKNNPTTEDIEALYTTISKDGFNISKTVLNYIVLQRKSFLSDNTYNLELDAQLVKALDVVTQPYKAKEYKYFHTTRNLEDLKEREKKALELSKKRSETNK